MKIPKAIRLFMILTLCCVALAAGPQVQGPQNLAFDNGDLGAAPSGWHLPTPGYTARVIAEGVAPGKRAVELALSDPATPSRFGDLVQTFDAAAYRGKQVRFRAAVRVAGATAADRVQLGCAWIGNPGRRVFLRI